MSTFLDVLLIVVFMAIPAMFFYLWPEFRKFILFTTLVLAAHELPYLYSIPAIFLICLFLLWPQFRKENVNHVKQTLQSNDVPLLIVWGAMYTGVVFLAAFVLGKVSQGSLTQQYCDYLPDNVCLFLRGLF